MVRFHTRKSPLGFASYRPHDENIKILLDIEEIESLLFRELDIPVVRVCDHRNRLVNSEMFGGAILSVNDLWDEGYLDEFHNFDYKNKPVFMLWMNHGTNTWNFSNTGNDPKNVFVFNINKNPNANDSYKVSIHSTSLNDSNPNNHYITTKFGVAKWIANRITTIMDRYLPEDKLGNPYLSERKVRMEESPMSTSHPDPHKNSVRIDMHLSENQIQEIVNKVANAQVQALIHLQQTKPELTGTDDVSKRLSTMFQRIDEVSQNVKALQSAVTRIENTVNQAKQTNLQIVALMEKVTNLLANKDEVNDICNALAASEHRVCTLIKTKLIKKEEIVPVQESPEPSENSEKEFDLDTYLLTISETFTKHQTNVELDLDYFTGPNVGERINLLKEFERIFLKNINDQIEIRPIEMILLGRLRIPPSTVSWMGTSLKVREVRTYKDCLSMKKTGVFNHDKFVSQKWFQALTKYLNLAGVRWKNL